MSTKAPAPVQQFPPESMEAKAYASVNTIPTVEPNDRTRLGYHVYRWLKQREGTLEQAIAASGSRLEVTQQQAAGIIRESLKSVGIEA